jgi:hypothetical protein
MVADILVAFKHFLRDLPSLANLPELAVLAFGASIV